MKTLQIRFWFTDRSKMSMEISIDILEIDLRSIDEIKFSTDVLLNKSKISSIFSIDRKMSTEISIDILQRDLNYQ